MGEKTPAYIKKLSRVNPQEAREMPLDAAQQKDKRTYRKMASIKMKKSTRHIVDYNSRSR